MRLKALIDKTLIRIGKTLFRTPLKTLLTFLLLAATSYMLFFSAAEYAVTNREFKRTKAYYQGTGAVEVSAFDPIRPEPIGRNRTPVSGTDALLYADERIRRNPYDYDDEVLNSLRYEGLKQSDIDAISRLPYVTSTSTRYMTAGISPDLKRPDLMNRAFLYPNYNYTARIVVEATVVRHVFRSYFTFYNYNLDEEQNLPYSRREPPRDENDWRARYIVFEDIKYIAGDKARLGRVDRETGLHERLTVEAISLYPDSKDGSVLGFYPQRARDRFSSLMHYGRKYYDEVYSYDYLDTLVPGERYIIIVRFGGPVLSDSTTIGWWPQVYPVKGLPENYLELDEFAPLREMIEITNADVRTFDVVYTDDMSSIMRFADEEMVMSEGRMITQADSAEGKNVCVMSSYYMRNIGLRVGDTIRLRLGDKLFEQNSAVGAVAVVRERFADNFTDEIEFEIIGAYKDGDNVAKREQNRNIPWTYSDNTIFVPLSFLPCDVPEDHVVKPGEFSFVIADASDIQTFLEEQAPVIEGELGLTLFFNDAGWPNVGEQLEQGSGLIIVKLALYSLSVLIAVGLTVFLFVMRKRKEYAIMRALGTTKRISNRSMYAPLAVIAVVAMAAGFTLAYSNASGAMAGSLEAYAKLGLPADAAIPFSMVALCVGCELAALALVTGFALGRLGAKQPLELLAGPRQGDGSPVLSKTMPASRNAGADVLGRPLVLPLPTSRLPAIGTPARPRRTPLSFTIRHTSRHIRRSAVKSLLSIGIALLLAGTIGQLTIIRGTYRDAYESVGVKVMITNGLRLKHALEVAQSEYLMRPAKGGDSIRLKEPYFESTIEGLDCNYYNVLAAMTNDIQRYCDDEAEIEYLEGYDSSSMSALDAQECDICVLSGAFMDVNGIRLGDTVDITVSNIHYIVISRFLGSAETLNYLAGNTSDDDGQFAAKEALADKLAEESTARCKVVGRLSRGSERSDKVSVFVPVGRELDVILNWLHSEEYGASPYTISSYSNTWRVATVFEYIEYTVASSDYLEGFSKQVKRAIIESVGATRFSPLLIDTSEADSMTDTMDMLDNLYPIAVAVAVILGGLFPGLIAMQSDREASIMRVQGMAKKRARTMLVLEQAALYLLGLLCAAALLLAINGAAATGYPAQLLSYGLLHLAASAAGALICSVIVTRRSPLELLQVKE